MNITDIDDKIIKRARQNYLYEKYVEENYDFTSILADAKQVMSNFENTMGTITDSDKKCMLERMLNKLTKVIEDMEKAVIEKNCDEIVVLQEVRD